MRNGHRVSRELPNDFSLAKYEATKDFDLSLWVVNLEARALTAFLINYQRHNLGAGSKIGRRVQWFLENPICEISQTFQQDPGLTKYIAHTSVLETDVSTHFARRLDFDDSRFSDYVDAWKFLEESGDAFQTLDERRRALLQSSVREMYGAGGIDFDGDVSIEVNLHATDEKLISDFKNWLEAIRASTCVVVRKRNVTQSDFLDWNRFQILPYLDLMNWSKAHSVSLTQQAIGAALFPNEFNVQLAERIRKTIKPLAASICNEAFTDAIRLQAMGELAEAKTGKSFPDKYAYYEVPASNRPHQDGGN